MKHRLAPAADPNESLPPFPLDQELWQLVTESLGLCERHGRMVELLLRDASDQEIAIAIGVAPCTAKTILKRIRERTKAPTRMQLAMRVLAAVIEILRKEQRPPPG
jgi:DNA-binding CsgD family transcriptional regulator